jgi:hypothetical protein
MTPAEQRQLAGIRAELGRVARYDDESVVNDKWVRQRYDCGCFASFAPARKAAVRAAWHEAGHAVAALALGARFSSASIHHGCRTEGRVHGIRGAGELAFVIDAAGQIAERLMNWSMLEHDDQLRAWLPTWKGDGGDARHFRRALGPRFGHDELRAWRHSEATLVPRDHRGTAGHRGARDGPVSAGSGPRRRDPRGMTAQAGRGTVPVPQR